MGGSKQKCKIEERTDRNRKKESKVFSDELLTPLLYPSVHFQTLTSLEQEIDHELIPTHSFSAQT